MAIHPQWVVPLSWPSLDDAEIQAATSSLAGGWLTTGPKVAEFERAIAAYVGGETYCVATNSCSAGLLLALKALDIGPGDEVITTTNTFTGTASSIAHAGARPVLVDIDPITLNIDPLAVEGAITPRTKAIMPVHLGGLPSDMSAISTIARRYGLRVIEDAAHALTATSGGRRIGNSTAHATAFSFGPTKPITTGEGGMLLTPDPKVAARARRLSLQGIDRGTMERHGSRARWWQYDVLDAGYKFNMPDVSAAIGCTQLRKIGVFQARRAAIAARYLQAFEGLPLELPSCPPDGDQHSWHLFVMRLLPGFGVDRDDFIEQMAAAGIQCGVHYIPIHMHTFWQEKLSSSFTNFPVANDTFQRTVTLPLFAAMSDEQVECVVRTVIGLQGKSRSAVGCRA